MSFGFHARWIDCVNCGLFSNYAPLGLYSVLEKVEVRVTVSVTVCVVWDDDERKGEGETRCRLFSKSTKGAARLNVPIRRTNRYQQYYMPSQHGTAEGFGI